MRFYLSDSLPTLRLNFPGGDSNEYRVRQGCVEFRASQGAWRVLDESAVHLHFVLNTEVAQWLQRRKAEPWLKTILSRDGKSVERIEAVLDLYWEWCTVEVNGERFSAKTADMKMVKVAEA